MIQLIQKSQAVRVVSKRLSGIVLCHNKGRELVNTNVSYTVIHGGVGRGHTVSCLQ